MVSPKENPMLICTCPPATYAGAQIHDWDCAYLDVLLAGTAAQIAASWDERDALERLEQDAQDYLASAEWDVHNPEAL